MLQIYDETFVHSENQISLIDLWLLDMHIVDSWSKYIDLPVVFTIECGVANTGISTGYAQNLPDQYFSGFL